MIEDSESPEFNNENKKNEKRQSLLVFDNDDGNK